MTKTASAAPGRIELAHGPLRFSALVRGSGPLVLCLHGFPDHARSFAPQLEALADAGYRVVAPTMRGYEPSSLAADGDYRADTIAGDVVAWIESLGESSVHLVGHDWGAIVGYVATARFPERFRSFTALAIPNTGRIQAAFPRVPRQLLLSWYTQLFQLPGIAELVVSSRDWAFVDHLWQTWSPGFELPADERRELKQAFAAPGVRSALLGYYRQNVPPLAILGLARTAMASVGRIEVPTLAVTGADDGCIDTRLFDVCMQGTDFPRGLEVRRIAGAGHWVHREKPETVNRLLLEWIGRHPGAT